MHFSGVMHCFSSGATLAKRALAIGFYISFSGILTFNKSDRLAELLRLKSRLIGYWLRQISPYLAPTPHRGKSNEPAFTAHILAKLAEIRRLACG